MRRIVKHAVNFLKLYYNKILKHLLNIGFTISHIAEYGPNIKRGFDIKGNTALSFCDLVLHLILSLFWILNEVRFGHLIYFDSRIRESTLFWARLKPTYRPAIEIIVISIEESAKNIIYFYRNKNCIEFFSFLGLKFIKIGNMLISNSVLNICK